MRHGRSKLTAAPALDRPTDVAPYVLASVGDVAARPATNHVVVSAAIQSVIA
jgi:hypothetical protein